MTHVNLAYRGMRKQTYLSFISFILFKNGHFSTYANSYNRGKNIGALAAPVPMSMHFVVCISKEYAFFIFSDNYSYTSVIQTLLGITMVHRNDFKISYRSIGVSK